VPAANNKKKGHRATGFSLPQTFFFIQQLALNLPWCGIKNIGWCCGVVPNSKESRKFVWPNQNPN
jgi:hypothetical protein